MDRATVNAVAVGASSTTRPPAMEPVVRDLVCVRGARTSVADARFRRQDRRALLPRPQLRSGRSSATGRASPARKPSGSQADSFPSRARFGRHADVQTGCRRARTRREPERSQIVPRGSADRRPARMHARRSGRPHARPTACRVIPRRRSRTGRTARGTARPQRTKQAAYRPVGGCRRRPNQGA